MVRTRQGTETSETQQSSLESTQLSTMAKEGPGEYVLGSCWDSYIDVFNVHLDINKVSDDDKAKHLIRSIGQAAYQKLLLVLSAR